MFFSIFGFTAANLIYLVLHVTNSGSFPRPLSADEEKHYLNLLKKGDENARNVLIERNLRLVAHIIKKYYANARDQDDLISIGTIGLIKAVSTFDSDKGTRLATYAARCIENAIPLSMTQVGILCPMAMSCSTSLSLCIRSPMTQLSVSVSVTGGGGGT